MLYKRTALWLFFTLIGLAGFSQLREAENARWKFEVPEGTKVKAGSVIDLVFTADIGFGWALYSNDFTSDIGPLPTEFNFVPNETYKLVGTVVPQNPSRKKDRTWDVEYTYFNSKAVFKQKIQVLKKDFAVSGTVKGLTCSELDGLCVPFSTDFRF